MIKLLDIVAWALVNVVACGNITVSQLWPMKISKHSSFSTPLQWHHRSAFCNII